MEHRLAPEALAGLIDEVIGWFRAHPGYEELRRLFTELVKQAIEGGGVTLTIPDDLREMKTMLATLGETWKQQWKAEGKAEGEAMGMSKGKAEGLHEGQARTLVRLLGKRFGPVSDNVRTRVETADLDTLDRWLDRVLDAPTLEAVFDETAPH